MVEYALTNIVCAREENMPAGRVDWLFTLQGLRPEGMREDIWKPRWRLVNSARW